MIPKCERRTIDQSMPRLSCREVEFCSVDLAAKEDYWRAALSSGQAILRRPV
jgi:hypothetical protein